MQRKDKTLVYTPENLTGGTYKEHVMPHERYSLAHPNPASGVAGVLQFEADIRNLIPTM